MRKLVLIFSIFSLLATFAPQVKAQCPMCKASVESNHNNDTSPLAKGLNTGILLLFVLPYTSLMILAVVLFTFYKRRKRQEREREQMSSGENAWE